MAVKPSQTNVNKCATVVNNPLSPRAGGVFNPVCVLPRPILNPGPISGATSGNGGVFVTTQPARPRIDSVLPKGYK